MNKEQIILAKQIYSASHLTGEFLLRSGVTSDQYFDKYLFEADPVINASIAAQLRSKLEQLFVQADFLAGLEMGGIPIATMLSHVTQKPCLFVRKKAKEYGTCKLAEGLEFKNKHLLVIEDVVSSGGQIVISTNDLRIAGAKVTDAVCVIDREMGGKERLAENNIKLHSLFTMSELETALSL